MTWRMRRTGRRGRAAVTTAALLGLGGAACAAPPTLIPGQAVEGELAPGTEVSYRLTVAAGDYTRLVIAPTRDEAEPISARVYAPKDRPVVEAEEIRNEDGGSLAFVADESGTYRITVAASNPVAPASFRVEVVHLQPASEGDRDRAAAESSRAEARRLIAAGRRDDAVAAYQRSLASYRRAGDSETEFWTLIDLVAAEMRSDSERALAWTAEARSVADSAGRPDLAVEALNWRGRTLKSEGDCPGALAAYEESLSLAESIGAWQVAAIVAFNIGTLQKRCRPELADAAFVRAVDVAHQAGDRATEAVALSELALAARDRGSLEQARELVDRAHQLVTTTGDRQAEADIVHAVALIDRKQGRLSEAREHYLRCLELNESLGSRNHLPAVLLSLGTLALDLRRPQEARGYIERALQVADDLGDPGRRSQAELELGKVLYREERYPEAEKHFRGSLATAEGLAGAFGARSVAAARVMIGATLLQLDKPEEAVVQLEAALEYLASAESRHEEALARRSLGTALAKLGDRRRGLEQLAAALAISEDLGEPIGQLWTLYRLAEVESATNPTGALRNLEKAIAIGQDLRRGLASDSLRTEFAEGARRLYGLYVELLIEQGDPVAAFAASEEGRARALLDFLAEAQIDLTADAGPQLRDELQALDERIAWLQNELREAVAAPDAERTSAVREQLELAEQEWWRVEAHIRERSPRYRELQVPRLTGVEEVRRALPAGRALLEYWLGEERSYVFVLAQDVFEVLPLPPAREIRRDVASLRAELVRIGRPEDYVAVAHRVYRQLLGSALDAAGSAGRPIGELVIVPDGPLHLIPFEALVTSPAPAGRFQDLAYLLRRASVSYAPSASVLASLDGPRARGGDVAGGELEFLAFAAPRYDGPVAFDCPDSAAGSAALPASSAVRSLDLGDLRGAGREVRTIAAPYGERARVYEGSSASESRVKTGPEIGAARRLHFAVHGVACESIPGRSGLLLAPDADRGQDGILQTREIFELDLSADLVVLSACETGLGRLVSGEGVVGVARAFFYAGAPSLVVSLWQVSDRSTALLMASFYEAMDRGDDKAAALRRAQLELIDGDSSHSAPFFWAPFVLLGSRE